MIAPEYDSMPGHRRLNAPVTPLLERRMAGPIAFHTDPRLREAGVIVAFSERGGGASGPPYASLDLAGHVGDDPARVDENRRALLDALGVGALGDRLTTAEQVHGTRVALVDDALAGSGRAAHGRSPVPATDALVTSVPGVPLLMCFADCVPVLLVAPGPVVAVVHAGWRGALQRLPGKAAAHLASVARCEAAGIVAYIGPHICADCYQVGDEIMSHFLGAFGTVARAGSGGLDLGAVVHATLSDAGVPSCSIASLGACTAEEIDRFYSYRAEGGRTGRHGALACILP